jgi:spore coat protein CotH
MMRNSILAVVLAAAAGLLVHAQTNRPQPQLFGISAADAFYDDSVVHEIRLDINAKDWQSLKDHFRDNTYYPADFRWRDQVVRNIGIRSRGVASRSGTKPSLRLDFNRYTEGQHFLGLKSTIIKNDVTDASYMHDRLAMQLFRRLGMPAPRTAHAKLFINGVYSGLYTLTESIDKDFLSGNFGENDGYLFNYSWAYPYYFEDRGTDPGTYVPVPFEPETHESDPHPEVVVELVGTINHAVNFQSEMAQYIDLKKFIRHIAIEQFLADTDNFLGNSGMANFYLYRFQNTKRFQLIAWDKSEAFTSPLFDIFQHIKGVSGSQTNRLVARALELPDVYTTYLDTLIECANSINQPGTSDPRGWLDREIDREHAQIFDAGRTDPVKPFTNGEYDDAVTNLHDFAQKRGPFVAQSVASAR